MAPINLIFLGGSVTEGYNTRFDCKAPYDMSICENCLGRYTEGIQRYFQNIVSPNISVNLFTLAMGGWTCEVQADKVIDNLRKEGLVSNVFVHDSLNTSAYLKLTMSTFWEYSLII